MLTNRPINLIRRLSCARKSSLTTQPLAQRTKIWQTPIGPSIIIRKPFRSDAYQSAHQFDTAIELCKKVVADNPTFGAAHQDLANAYWAEHNYPQAIQIGCLPIGPSI